MINQTIMKTQKRGKNLQYQVDFILFLESRQKKLKKDEITNEI